MNLPVAILAGGLATRLRPLTEKIPKALIEICGEPFLSHQLRLLSSAGVKKVVICAWYRGDLIREFAADGSRFGIEIDYSFDGDRPLGTGGALLKALPLLGEAFFILYGDSYLPCDYAAIESAFQSKNTMGMMTVYRNRDQGDRSNVHFNNGEIIAYDKRVKDSSMEYIDYGLGVLSKGAFASYLSGRPFDLAELYQKMIKLNQLAGYEVVERFYEIGSFKGIQDLENYLETNEGEHHRE